MLHRTMITIFVKEYNQFSQDFYNAVIDSLQLHRFICSCGHSGCLTKHAYYSRWICSDDGKVEILVCRVKCSVCGATHALLLTSIVPYSQISFRIQHQIIQAFTNGTNPRAIFEQFPDIDENYIRVIYRRFLKYWEARLLSEQILLSPASRLIRMCLALYHAQFMQIRRTFNSLAPEPT